MEKALCREAGQTLPLYSMFTRGKIRHRQAQRHILPGRPRKTFIVLPLRPEVALSVHPGTKRLSSWWHEDETHDLISLSRPPCYLLLPLPPKSHPEGQDILAELTMWTSVSSQSRVSLYHVPQGLSPSTWEKQGSRPNMFDNCQLRAHGQWVHHLTLGSGSPTRIIPAS